MKVLDLLMQHGDNEDGGLGAPAFPVEAQFTVDTGVSSVEAEYSAHAGNIYDNFLSDGFGNNRFPIYDNFLIISIGVSVPSPFTIVSNKVLLKFAFPDFEGNDAPFPGFGNQSCFILPAVNYEMPINLSYNPREEGFSPPRRIGATVTEIDGNPLQISMVGIPPAYQGETFGVSVFMKILHNTNLTGML